jgi:hypothetical protein
MQLQQGANTFYSTRGNIRWAFNALINPISTTQYEIDPSVSLNDKGYQFYLGGVDSNGIGPDRSINNMRFYLQEEPVSFGNGSFTNPRNARLYCGNPTQTISAFNSFDKTPSWWNPEINGSVGAFNQSPVLGNTIPPGRYVVTIRARDRNGAGLATEWDLPITIPPNSPSDNAVPSNFTRWTQTGGANPGCNQ